MRYLWVCCSHHPSVVWKFFLQSTETGLNSEKCTNRQDAENSNCSSCNGFGPNFTTMTKLSAGCPATLAKLSAVSPRPFVEPPSCVTVKRVVVFFVALDLLSFSLSYLLTARNGSVFFLGSSQVLVMQSFAFSFRLSKVGSLIDWLLRSFCIYRENPMLRIFEFSQLLWRRRCASPRRFCRLTLSVFLSTRSVTTSLCTLHWHTIVKVSLGGFRAFSDGPFPVSVSPGSRYILCSEGQCLAPRLLFFLIT